MERSNRVATLSILATPSLCAAVVLASDPTALDAHLRAGSDAALGEQRGLEARWGEESLQVSGDPLSAPSPAERYAWVVLPPPEGGWDLAQRASVEARIANTGEAPVDTILWVVGDHGWDAVPAAATLAPGEIRLFSCDLRETYPDGTPKIDPRAVKQIQLMVTRRGASRVSLELSELRAVSEAPPWRPPSGRLALPPVEEGPPTAGRRVRYRLADDEGGALYGILHLPEDWKDGESYPLVVEYPGNIFFTEGCYSTGLPEQCVIGYGMTKGRGALALALPFVDPAKGGVVAEHGWGDPDATADYAMRLIDQVCDHFGGDRENLVLTGFSRGAIACGFIGLRNDRIASLWKGFHACQHYDGGGWNGATMEGALERAKRFRGSSVFQTDNSPDTYAPVVKVMRERGASLHWENSGLGAHATAMFLDERPSTRRLRRWFAGLVGISGADRE